MSFINKRSYEPSVVNGTYITNTQTHYRTTDFVNLSSVIVVILDRQNMPVILQPAPAGTAMSPPRIEVRTHYQYFDNKNIRDTAIHVTNMNTNIEGLGEDRKNLLETIHNSEIDGIRRSISFTSVRKVPLSDILKTGCLFDQSSGYLFTADNKHLTTLHPESNERRARGNHEQYVSSRPTGMLIEIVDNNNSINDRFTYAFNTVLKIGTVVDPDRTEGVYVTSVSDVGMSTSETNTVRYSLGEAEIKFGMYRTREEALTKGDPELISKNLLEKTRMELEEAKNKASLMESENRQLEAQKKKELMELEVTHKEKILAMEAKNKEMSSELARLKEELEKRKIVREDYYESRSSDRKDTSEIIKFIPAVLGGFIAAALLFRK